MRDEHILERHKAFLRALVPYKMALSLEVDILCGSTDWAAEQVMKYLAADEAGRADILAFFESGGPGMVKDAHQRSEKAEHGTPTSAELNQQLGVKPEPKTVKLTPENLVDLGMFSGFLEGLTGSERKRFEIGSLLAKRVDDFARPLLPGGVNSVLWPGPHFKLKVNGDVLSIDPNPDELDEED